MQNRANPIITLLHQWGDNCALSQKDIHTQLQATADTDYDKYGYAKLANHNNETPLMLAVKYKNKFAVEWLLTKTCDPNAHSENQLPAIALAVSYTDNGSKENKSIDREILDLLLNSTTVIKLPLDEKESEAGPTAIIRIHPAPIAAVYNNLYFLKYYFDRAEAQSLKGTYKSYQKDMIYQQILQQAIQHIHNDALELINKSLPLLNSIYRENDITGYKYQTNDDWGTHYHSSKIPTFRTINGIPLLHYALSQGNVIAANILIKTSYFTINERDSDDRSTLTHALLACKAGKITEQDTLNIVNLLVRLGETPSNQDCVLAIEITNASLLKIFLDTKKVTLTKDWLEKAAISDKIEVLDFLLANGGQPYLNRTTPGYFKKAEESPALIAAINAEKIDAVKFLLSKGAKAPQNLRRPAIPNTNNLRILAYLHAWELGKFDFNKLHNDDFKDLLKRHENDPATYKIVEKFIEDSIFNTTGSTHTPSAVQGESESKTAEPEPGAPEGYPSVRPLSIFKQAASAPLIANANEDDVSDLLKKAINMDSSFWKGREALRDQIQDALSVSKTFAMNH